MNEVESYGEKNVELLLLGNKSDDGEKRVVSLEKAKVIIFFIFLSFCMLTLFSKNGFFFLAFTF